MRPESSASPLPAKCPQCFLLSQGPSQLNCPGNHIIAPENQPSSPNEPTIPRNCSIKSSLGTQLTGKRETMAEGSRQPQHQLQTHTQQQQQQSALYDSGASRSTLSLAITSRELSVTGTSTLPKEGPSQLRQKLSQAQMMRRSLGAGPAPSLLPPTLRVNSNYNSSTLSVGPSPAPSVQFSEVRRGSLQQKIRSIWFSSKDIKKDSEAVREATRCSVDGEQGPNGLRSKSKSTPALNAPQEQNMQPQCSATLSAAPYAAGQLQLQCPSVEAQPIVEYDAESSHYRELCSNLYARDPITGRRPLVANSNTNQSPKVSRNLKSTLYEKVIPKESIAHQVDPNGDQMRETVQPQVQSHHRFVEVTRTRGEAAATSTFSPNEEKHVVVVNGFEGDFNRDQCLTVRPQQQPPLEVVLHNDSNSCSEQSTVAKGSLPKPSPDRGGSSASPETAYKSSSESGRGTMSSDVRCLDKTCDENSPLDMTSLDSDHSGSCLGSRGCDQDSKLAGQGKGSGASVVIEKMQQELQRILDDGNGLSTDEEPCPRRLAVVLESESWVSDSSTCRQVISKPSESSSKGKTIASHPNAGENRKYFSSSYQQKHEQKAATTKPATNGAKAAYSCSRGAGNSTATQKAQKPYTSGGQKSKTRSMPMSSRKWQNPSADCDIASTTTGGIDSVAEYPDDLTSEYTANTSCFQDDSHLIRKQLKGLEGMYSEILKVIGNKIKPNSRLSTHGSKGRRKLYGSQSSLTTVNTATSRGTFNDHYTPRSLRSASRGKKEENRGSSNGRLKRLEAHVVTLARSVAHLSSEIRTNHALVQEMDSIRRDVERVQQQMKYMRVAPEPATPKRPHKLSDSQHLTGGQQVRSYPKLNEGMDINPVRVEKLTRFFGDEPPVLRQFLKKLGYEKYMANFESEKIGINELVYLSEERLQKIGLPMGPRVRILQETHKLRMTGNNSKQENQYSVYIV